MSRVLDLKGSGLDVCISGLPGWLSLRPAEALTASTRTSSSSGGGRRAATSRNCQLEGRLTVWVPKGVEVFEEEDRKKGVFVGRQFYIHDPDGSVIEFTEWDGTSILD